MLEEFFESPFRIQELRNGPNGRLLEGFAQELCKAGYAEITARRHIRAAEQIGAHATARVMRAGHFHCDIAAFRTQLSSPFP